MPHDQRPARSPLRELEIRDEVIRLGQFLKLAGLVDTGADAKAALEEGLVTVGGRPENRRGRQLVGGDVVAMGGERVRVAVRVPGDGAGTG